MDPLKASTDVFSGLGMSSLLQNASLYLPSNSLSSSDLLSQFLQSSQDFNLDTMVMNISESASSYSVSPTTISKGVADEIPQCAQGKSGEVGLTPSPSLTPVCGLKWSDFLGKQQIGCFDDKKTDNSNPERDQTAPPNAQAVKPNDEDKASTDTGGVKLRVLGETPVVSPRIRVPTSPVPAAILVPLPKRKASVQGDSVIIKKRKRQEKNREAAQLFRQRQKAKVVELEKKMEVLINMNHSYRHSIETLFSENKVLAEQLLYWKNVVASGILITRMPGYTEGTVEARQNFLGEFKKVAESMPVPSSMRPMPQ